MSVVPQSVGNAQFSPVATSPTEISPSFLPPSENFRITELPASTVQTLPSASPHAVRHRK